VTIRKNFSLQRFRLVAIVLAIPFVYIVVLVGIFYVVRPGDASRNLAVTSHYVRLADQKKRVNDLLWSDCCIGATCFCDRIVSKFSFGFNSVSIFK